MVWWRFSEILEIELAAAVRHDHLVDPSSNQVRRLARALFPQDERAE